MKHKSSIAMNKIRTGNGDGGSTKLGAIEYRKGHPVIRVIGSLDLCQRRSFVLPKRMGDAQPRSLFQNMMFFCGAALAAKDPRAIFGKIEFMTSTMEDFIDTAGETLAELDSFILADEGNGELMYLGGLVRQAEVDAVAARDYLELHERQVSENRVAALDIMSKGLNVTGDWVFRFVELATADDHGKVSSASKWLPWSDEDFARLASEGL